jgi:hypothetical protein
VIAIEVRIRRIFGVLFLRNRAGVIAGSRCEEDSNVACVFSILKLTELDTLWRRRTRRLGLEEVIRLYKPVVARAARSAGRRLPLRWLPALCPARPPSCRPRLIRALSARTGSPASPRRVLLHPLGESNVKRQPVQKTTDLRNSAQWLTAWINMIRIGDRAPSGAGQWCLGRDHRRRG